MNFIPSDHAFLIEAFRTYLDQTFTQIYHTKSVIKNSNLKKLVSNPANQSQIYDLDENHILRFDHTHSELDKDLHLPQKSFGPVFRNGAKYHGRYREFFQYDVDYPYEDYKFSPLETLKKLFNPLNFTIVVNDLAFLRTYLGLDMSEALVEDSIELKEMVKSLDRKDYSTKLGSHLAGVLNLESLELDPLLVRGWSYYMGLVFEIRPKVYPSLSVAGGGLYLRNKKKVFGFGIGLSRLIYVLKRYNLLDQFLPKKPLLLVVYKDQIPVNLVEALVEHKTPYILKLKTQALIKLFKKVERKTPSPYYVGATLVVSLEEDQKKHYWYKEPHKEKQLYSLKALLSLWDQKNR